MQTLDHKYNIAKCDYFPIVTSILGSKTYPSFGGIVEGDMP
jgi:hypothetical protein